MMFSVMSSSSSVDSTSNIQLLQAEEACKAKRWHTQK